MVSCDCIVPLFSSAITPDIAGGLIEIDDIITCRCSASTIFVYGLCDGAGILASLARRIENARNPSDE
jgi:hypothetical protein